MSWLPFLSLPFSAVVSPFSRRDAAAAAAAASAAFLFLFAFLPPPAAPATASTPSPSCACPVPVVASDTLAAPDEEPPPPLLDTSLMNALWEKLKTPPSSLAASLGFVRS